MQVVFLKNIAKNIMSSNLVTISPNSSIKECCKIMKKYDIGFLPVMENDNILGVITDRDIVLRAENENFLNDKVSKYMTAAPLQFVTEETSISDVIFTMSNYKIRRLLVLNNDNLLSGVISLKDIVLYSAGNINNIANIFTESHFKYL